VAELRSGSASGSVPSELADLLAAGDEAATRRAWDRFLEAYHRLVLHTALRTTRNRDTAMDGYAFVLEKLREDDFRRLRAFEGTGRAKFTTWLVVITRRMVLDHQRSRYGRQRGEETEATRDQLSARRRLADLVSDVVDVEATPDTAAADPGLDLRLAERRAALARALSELEPADQLLLSLRFVDGAAGRDIADLMGMPTPFHAYRRINVVLARLRTCLVSQGIDDAGP
jgi:RNA polymerase sigma factor (sigma-70 family)